jgi:hypothetical protein
MSSQINLDRMKHQKRGLILLAILSILFIITASITLGVILAYYGIASEIHCDKLNPNLSHSIIESKCLGIPNNNTHIIVQITNCDDKTNIGYIVPQYNEKFAISNKCWYSAGDVYCNQFNKSNLLLDSNMTISYNQPMGVTMWNNYIDCINNKNQLYNTANWMWLYNITIGLVSAYFISFFLLNLKSYIKDLIQEASSTHTQSRIP